MATLKRGHVPVPWGAQVEQTVWERSKRGKPRRKRTDRPTLAHDHGWDWDGTRILFSEKSVAQDGGEADCDAHVQLCEDNRRPLLLERTCVTLSLLDAAQYQISKRRGKARSGLGEFEVVRVPKVVPVAEEESDLGACWELGEWEKLDILGFKRSYSEVVQGLLDGEGPLNAPGCSRPASNYAEDDPWEYL